MPKINGFDEALKLLQLLGPSEQEKLLSQMALKEPKLVEKLKKSIVSFEDLQYLTPEMMRVLLQGVTTDELGLALKVASSELVTHICSFVSKNNERDIRSVLEGSPQAVSKVREAQEKIMTFVREKINTGEIVIDKSGSETLV